MGSMSQSRDMRHPAEPVSQMRDMGHAGLEEEYCWEFARKAVRRRWLVRADAISLWNEGGVAYSEGVAGAFYKGRGWVAR